MKKKSVHFVGIGGVGMSGIASILLEKGESVSGSDMKESEVIKKLRKKGARIFRGHKSGNVARARLLVISSAISGSNPELAEAGRRGIPVIPRAEMLSSLMEGRKRIVITGTHGKTTTSSMEAFILRRSGLNPDFAVGGYVEVMGGANSGLGSGKYFVAEADESDGSFLRLKPDIGVVTNIEAEHLDHYGSVEKLKKAFWEFACLIPAEGTAILNADDANVSRMIKKKKQLRCAVKTYSIKNRDAYFFASKIKSEAWGSSFEVLENRARLGTIMLRVPGIHNVSNALAAAAAALEAGAEFAKISRALTAFRNARRRIEIKGEEKGVLVIDDYAHHPSEIDATMRVARGLRRRRMIVVFQPHRYSRTKLLGKELGRALSKTDVVILTRIYSAGEKVIEGVDSGLILNEIKGKEKKYIPENEKAAEYIAGIARPGDLVLTMGAGDVYTIGEELLKKLKRQNFSSKVKGQSSKVKGYPAQLRRGTPSCQNRRDPVRA